MGSDTKKPSQGFRPKEGAMSKEEMIQRMLKILRMLYYEDLAFFCGMLEKFAEKKGINAET